MVQQSANLATNRLQPLPVDAPYLCNMASLWARDAVLARAIELLEEQPSYPLTPARSGAVTIARQASDGATIFLHSRYDPVAEASQLVDGLPTAEKSAFYVCGFSLGYHVQALFERASEDALIWVFEPDLLLLRTAFECGDFSNMIDSGRVTFVTTADKASLFGQFMPNAATLALGFEEVIHPPSLRIAPAFHEQMRQLVDEYRAYCKTTISTLVHNSKRTAENIAANLSWYVSTPSLSRLENHYRGKPAIIVSAGPSLRKNKHLLKDAAGHAVMIAVQTTLQPLLEMGIEPDYVTSLDYHDICTRFFERLPSTLRTELVAEAKASDAIFGLFPGPISLLGNEFAESLLSEMKLNKTRLNSGATVAHLAYYLADHLGCDPIIFVGQDLGFSDGLCYMPGTSYEDVWQPELSRFCTVEMKQWEQIVRDRPILRRVSDFEGNPTYTEERLFTYLQHFEREFAVARHRVIDATEGGVRKRGAEPMKLTDALNRYCSEPLSVDRPHYPGRDREDLSGCVLSLQNRRREAREIKRIAEETVPLLDSLSQRIEDQPFVNRTIARIDTLRTQMDAFLECYGLITQLTQSSELDKFRADRQIAASRVEGSERQRRQVRRDIDNVKAIASAAVQFIALMDQVLDRMMPAWATATEANEQAVAA